jgi:hypothetical protein
MTWYKQFMHIVKNRYRFRRTQQGKGKYHAMFLALVDVGDLMMYSLLYGRL